MGICKLQVQSLLPKWCFSGGMLLTSEEICRKLDELPGRVPVVFVLDLTVDSPTYSPPSPLANVLTQGMFAAIARNNRIGYI